MKNLIIRFGLLISLMASIILSSCKDDDLEKVGPVAYKQQFSVYENASNNDFVGIVRVFSNRTNEKVTFSIAGGNESNAFAIDSTSGKITVANADALDYEKLNEFDLKVVAKDNSGNTDSTNVIIDVKNYGIPFNNMVCCMFFANSLKDYITDKTATSSNVAYFFDRRSWQKEALQFMGYKSYVILDSSYDFPERTISFWFMALNADGLQVIYSSDNELIQNGATYVCTVRTDAPKLLWQVGNALDSIAISENTWYHTAITVKPGQTRFYLNGKLVSTKQITELWKSGSGCKQAVLGVHPVNLNIFYFQGLIDDLFIYNKTLSESDIKVIYSEPDYMWY